MNTTRNHLSTFLGLNRSERRRTTRMRFAITSVAAFATAVQLIVWLLIGIFSSDLDSPWWFWTPASAMAINAALLISDHGRSRWSAISSHTEVIKESL